MDDYSQLDLALTYFREFVTDESPRVFDIFWLIEVSMIVILQFQAVLFSLIVRLSPSLSSAL